MMIHKMAMGIQQSALKSAMTKKAVSPVTWALKYPVTWALRHPVKTSWVVPSAATGTYATGVLLANSLRLVNPELGARANRWITSPVRGMLSESAEGVADQIATNVNKSVDKIADNVISKAEPIGEALARVMDKTKGTLSTGASDLGNAAHAVTFKSLIPLAGASVGGGIGGTTGSMLAESLADDKDDEKTRNRKKVFGGMVGTGVGAVGGFLLANRYKEVMYDLLSGNSGPAKV